MPNKESTTDFGKENVTFSEKTRRVGEVFTSVAKRYDLMNDLMSLGVHRLWKRAAIGRLLLRPGQKVLDLAGGSGDLTLQMAPQVGENGEVCLTDINESMLSVGRDRVINANMADRVRVVLADAEKLPFSDRYFDRVIISFGLRNVSHKDWALSEMHRVLKPGGKLVVLEFSHPHAWLSPTYNFYSTHIIPKMGSLILDDEDSYHYLVESIRRHPNQETLLAMFKAAGFERARYKNYTSGIVAIHEGYRI